MRLLVLVMVSLLLPAVMNAQSGKGKPSLAYTSTLKKVTDVMVNDVTSPVAASRYYAYINLAAYEAASLYRPTVYPSFHQQLNKYNSLAVPDSLLKETDSSLVVLLTILKTGQRLLPSGYMMKAVIDSLTSAYLQQPDAQRKYVRSADIAYMVTTHVAAYAKADGFTRLNNLPRYTPKEGDGFWKPTPPGFIWPIEPHWRTLRPFTLDSAAQYKTRPPAPYDTVASSSFYQQLKEVYDYGKKATAEQKEIAMYWDCNPFAIQQIGHVEFGLKKISPGGHWIGITGIACRMQQLSMGQTAYVHALVSFALADAFIACWDEKYRSDRVRPETVIHQLMDQMWMPLLQTPPFPEYVSGHSVASTAAAEVLTKLFGDRFAFTDNTEVEFGLKERAFPSFRAAAAEAAISRLYGGIHYRDAITEGEWLGKKVGEHLISRLSAYFLTLSKK
ncbi:vanadium-dependent haloperoxidase [Flavihumibacter rivuli]|uniref:vanadium-dependent haloperoxidase n=1 Tax=Flavihumibacter rivuli TaxID=2838156 RepID=UPI001BDEE074|nr:vanadium-dependent haloperoxidase [Flavihumibacter rivuli]ULQ56972.1 vanadium-dependent haloperoxidase [Flavihumibacter rivuli]